MNISYCWLRKLAPTIQDDPRQLADRLGMLGAPVDELEEIGAPLADVLIARVEEVRAHPNADRLRICRVDAGGEPLQVVCGAPNVEAGVFYPFAPVGSTLPGGMEIRKAKIRGEWSEGMLCSARELGLGRDHAGLLALAGDWEPGSSFVERLHLDDARLVLDVTANRPDLLSHLGVARELAPGGEADLRVTPFSDATEGLETATGERTASSTAIRVTIEDAADCPRYLAAVLEGVRIGPSPDWLAMRLRAVGIRPINNVVDATNYVLQELGQPLHAFDLDRLSGREIRVRRARPGESLRTLDGVTRLLEATAIVIADGDRPVALAGIMGGEESEVSESTTRILLECALFDPRLVRKTARSLGLSTDASHRFERGVDPEEQPRAVERVIDLILSVAGGAVVGPVLDAHPAPAARTRVVVRPQRVKQLLGVELPGARIRELLEPIGFSVEASNDAVRIVVPPYRPDVTREIDVIEEIARRHGYDAFDVELTHFRVGTVPPDPLLTVQQSLHELFARWGLREARTAAFAPPGEHRVPLLNPLSSEESHLRNDLVSGLLRRVEHNWAHGVRSIRLYEVGSVFWPSPEAVPRETVRVAIALTGPSRPPHWSESTPAWDVWDLKGLMTELGELLGAPLVADAGPPTPSSPQTGDEPRRSSRAGGDAGDGQPGVGAARDPRDPTSAAADQPGGEGGPATPDGRGIGGAAPEGEREGPRGGRDPGLAYLELLDETQRFVVRRADGEVLGWGGRVLPASLDAPPWAEPVWGIELALPAVTEREVVHFRSLPTYPPVERDLALLVPAGVEAAAIERAVREAAGEDLEEVWPFDLYSGSGIPEGHRSIAWRLRFRHPERTLTDAEVEAALKNALRRLEELGVRRR